MSIRVCLFGLFMLIPCASFAQAQTIAITGGKVVTMGSAGTLDDATVLIRDGRIAAVGTSISVPDNAKVIDAQGRWVTPGIINGFTRLTLVEVSAEASTNDAAAADAPLSAALDVTYALNPNTTARAVTRIEGVTRAIVAPAAGPTLYGGEGALIHTGIGAELVTRSRLFQYVELGEQGARIGGGSRLAAWGYLKTTMDEARALARGQAVDARGPSLLGPADAAALARVVSGDTRLVIRAARASDLRNIIRLVKDIGALKPIMVGAEEGWMVADELASADIPVIIYPFTNLPERFESLGATMANAARLHAAGVDVIFGNGPGQDDSHQPRLVLQYVGNAVANGMPWAAAMAALTTTPAKVYGVANDFGSLERGKVADVVVWTGDPLELMTRPTDVIIGGVQQPLVSRQVRLRDRYLELNNAKTKPFAYRK